MPEPRLSRDLRKERAVHVPGFQERPRGVDAEILLRDVAREDARVVAVAMNGARAARETVLLETLGATRRRAREVHIGHADALEEWRLRRDPFASRGDHAELLEVAERWREPGRRDHVIGLEVHRATAVAARRPHAVGARRARDLVDRGIEHRDATAEHVILVRLNIAGANADE